MDAYVYLKKKQKILRDQPVTAPDGSDSEQTIAACLEQILLPWDIPRPMIMARHIRDFEAFGRSIFKPDDFVEFFPYDTLEVECVIRPDGIREDLEFFDEFF